MYERSIITNIIAILILERSAEYHEKIHIHTYTKQTESEKIKNTCSGLSRIETMHA